MTGLQKQHVQIQLGQGIDTNTDKKLVVPGKLVELKNGVFKKTGRIDKRNGYDRLSSQTISGDVISNGSAIQIFNKELLQYAGQRLYSLSESIGKWIDKGPVVSSFVETKQIVKNTASQSIADYATKNGVGVYAYEDSRGGIRASVYDEASSTFLVADVEISAGGTAPICVAFNTWLYVFYSDSGSLFARRINAAAPSAFEAEVEIDSDLNTTDPNFDVVPFQNLRILFVLNNQSATKITVGWLDEELNVLTGTLGLKFINEEAENCLQIVEGPSNLFYVCYHNATDGLRCSIRNVGGTAFSAIATLDPYTATAITRVAGYPSADLTKATIFYEIEAADPENTVIGINTLTKTGTAGTPAEFLRSVGLWSRGFKYAFASLTDDFGFVCVTHASELQNTYFIARSDGVIVGKMQYSNGTGLKTRSQLSRVNAISDHEFSFAVLNKYDLVSESGSLFSLQGVSSSTIDFDASEQFNSVQLGDNLHITGGILSMYDGQSVVEHGFHLYPEGLSAVEASGGSIASGSYRYIALYEWTDNYGQVHRSAPSLPLDVTITGGPKKATVTVPTLRLTQKTGSRSDISIVLYRTEEGPQEIYYRVTSVSSPTYNDVTVDSVAIEDTLADASILGNELLYTTGDVLENIPAPSCRIINTFANRVFIAGLENPYEIWYSKQYAAGEAVEFSNFLRLDISTEGGAITALANLDDKNIFFKQDRFFATFGDGPNNTGAGGSFADPQLISSDVGCDTQNSVVRYPIGIMFKSSKGIYALDSALNVDYIGAEVDDFNSYQITSAILMSGSNEVRFSTGDGPVLVYDYFVKQWSTFDPFRSLDTVIYQQKFVFLGSDGNIYRENTGYKDDGKGISLGLVTGWLSFDSIVGFQRVYAMMIVGEYKSYHKLRVSVGYDFSETYQSVYVMDTNDTLAISTFGEQSPFGNQTPFGGDSNAYRFSFGMDIQKCTAIRFKIEDLTTSATEGSGEAFNITSLGLTVGIKGQMDKFRDRQVIASR